jgi:hypothetical protein
MVVSAQYSNYYEISSKSKINANVNVNANINKNVNVSGTVSTIDYGALANANAQREANRISSQQYANQRAKDAAIAIAIDPSKAYDYGSDIIWKKDRKQKKKLMWGKKLKYMSYKSPHSSLFVRVGGGTFENTSVDGIKTEINIYSVASLKAYIEGDSDFNSNLEEQLEYRDMKVGELNDFDGIEGAMLHKKDIKRASVGGNRGFRGTLIWEDKYEKCITDIYGSSAHIKDRTYIFFAKVRYKGDVDEVSFEQLEGRRYYFRTLMDKIISTIRIY